MLSWLSSFFSWSQNTAPTCVPTTTQVKLKFILIGATSVGKTSIMHQLAYRKWVPVLPNTLGPCDFPRTNMKVGENDVQLAGQERFGSITKLYYRGANLALCVYDITSRSSFESALSYVQTLKEHRQCTVILVGNKIDLIASANVSEYEGKTAAFERGCLFAQVTAKNSIELLRVIKQGVMDLFDRVATGEVNIEAQIRWQKRNRTKKSLKSEMKQAKDKKLFCDADINFSLGLLELYAAQETV